MASYKVLQDIEAEDKLLGPLTLRQFIYALITAACGYFTYLLASKNAGLVTPVFIIPGLFTAFFAFPWSREQPTEVWALAKLRFLFKPRKRIWNQSGVKELVTITVPKKIEQFLTNGLSQGEVESRLTALARTIDSRGWATRQPMLASEDRLIDMSSMPQEVPAYDVSAENDILDDHNNPLADHLDSMIATKARDRREAIIGKMKSLSQEQAAPAAQVNPMADEAPKPDYWFMDQSQTPGQPQTQVMTQSAPPIPAINPGEKFDESGIIASPEEIAIADKAKQLNEGLQKQIVSHIKTIEPIEQQPQNMPIPDISKTVTAPTKPDIIKPVNSNDLNVAAGDGEVVISLH